MLLYEISSHFSQVRINLKMKRTQLLISRFLFVKRLVGVIRAWMWLEFLSIWLCPETGYHFGASFSKCQGGAVKGLFKIHSTQLLWSILRRGSWFLPQSAKDYTLALTIYQHLIPLISVLDFFCLCGGSLATAEGNKLFVHYSPKHWVVVVFLDGIILHWWNM